jgi:hypothetical protein
MKTINHAFLITLLMGVGGSLCGCFPSPLLNHAAPSA